MQVKDSIEIIANRTIDVLDNGLAYYNYEGNHFRLFATKNDALAFVKNNDDSLVIKEFDDEESLNNYLEICYSIQKGTIVQNIVAAYSMEIFVNKFYTIERIDKDFIHFDNDISIFTIRNELFRNFRIISSIDDIEDLESKILSLKEAFVSVKDELKPLGLDIIEMERSITQRAIERINGDKVELEFLCNNIEITMIEQCSCCGKVLMPDDESYSDDLNDGAALCDHCSIFNEDTNNYQKAVPQNVIEKITGLKFSPHIGTVGSKVEEFNHWLNRYKLVFSYSEESSKQNFIDFINGCTEFNICDCCGLIEKSVDLAWTVGEFDGDELEAICFINSTLNIDAICQNCLDMFISRTHLSLHDIVQRIKENQMIYRVGDLVVLENVNFDEKNIFNKKYIDYIVSFDEKNKTYKLKEYGDIEFKEDDFYDIANEAYISEYTKFIASKYPDLSEDVDQWADVRKEGIPDIKSAFEEFGFKDEFIELLKVAHLPYGRLLTPKFNIGEEFNIHFNHYNDGEFTTHKIVRIDTSFTEIEDIVYWSDEYVFISEFELEKQKSLLNEELDEVDIVKNDILQNIFCIDADNDIVVPTFNELNAADEYQPNWQLTEDYQNYSLPSIIQIVNEQTENFFTTLEVLNSHKEKFRKSKKYGFRETVEFGVPYEVVKELQRLHEIYDEKDLNDEPEMICLQANITTQDYSTIEVVLGFDIHESELLHYLKSTVSSEHYEEIDLLVEAIKEAKVDNHETLYIYDC